MKKITVVGGMNVDIEGNPYGQINHGASNPGTLAMSFSGTGLDIAKNLALLGDKVVFAGLAGDDSPGKMGKVELAELGVDVSKMKFVPEHNTPMILEIRNIMDDLEMAFGNADVMEKMDKAFLEDAMDEMKSSALVAVDGNLNEEALAYLFDELQDVPVFFDPENPQKAARAKEYIGKFYMIKPNRLEAEAITGMEILSEEQLYAAGDWFAEKGVKKIFISLSGGGVFYREGDKAGILRPKNIVMKNTIGAGDTFSAALIHGELKGLDIEALANYAMAASEIKLETKEAVNPRLSEEEIAERMKNE